VHVCESLSRSVCVCSSPDESDDDDVIVRSFALLAAGGFWVIAYFIEITVCFFCLCF